MQTASPKIEKISKEVLFQKSGFPFYDLIGSVLGESLIGITIPELRTYGIPEPVIRIHMIRGFCNEVASGGMAQFFEWFNPEDVEYVIESLNIIGEAELAQLIEYGIPLAIEADCMFEKGRNYEPFKSYKTREGYDNLENDFNKAYELVEGDTFYANFASYVKDNVECFAK